MKAKENIKLYTNNRIAKLQGENDFDGIIAVADEMLAVNPQDALAQKIRLQALFDKKDYAGVIASAERLLPCRPTKRSAATFISFWVQLTMPARCPSRRSTPFRK